MCFSGGITVFGSGNNSADYEAIDRQLAADVDTYHIPAMAVAVVDKDGVLFERYLPNQELPCILR